MESYEIIGGRPLMGTIKLSGAKNLASKLLLATLLTDETCLLENMPRHGETLIATNILERAGKRVDWRGVDSIEVTSASHHNYDLRQSGTNRLPILAVGPLLHRDGRALVPLPSGDRIGNRPINFHLSALKNFGAQIFQFSDYVDIQANTLRGTKIILPYPSVGATESILLTASRIPEETRIQNGATEPELLELAKFLRSLGVRIERHDRTWIILGKSKLSGAAQKVMPDRIEAVSYAAAALATRGSVLIEDAHLAVLDKFLTFVKCIGGVSQTTAKGILFQADGELKATHITTNVHPGFMTDWQQPSTMILLTAKGKSIIHETVYDNRFGYLASFKTMGVEVEIHTQCPPEQSCRFADKNFPHVAYLNGPIQLRGAEVIMPDIRAGMAHVIAALIASGKSRLTGVEHLDRGYENLSGKLIALGANIRRQKS